MKIVFITLAGVGDTLMATPTIAEITKKYPKAEKHVLVFKGAHKEIFQNSDYIIHELEYYKRLPTKKKTRWIPYYKEILILLSLRMKKFDLSITPYPYHSKLNAMATKIINAKRRIGFEMNAYTDKVNIRKRVYTDKDLHDIEQNLRLLEPLGIKKPKEPQMFFPITKKERQFIKGWLKDKPKKIFCFHTTAYWKRPTKVWASERFALLADILSKKYNTTTILLGVEDDREKIKEIANKMKTKPIIVTNFTLKQVGALLEKSSLFLGSDSLLMHLAASLDIPTIGFFRYYGYSVHYPYNNKSIVITKKIDDETLEKMRKEEEYFKWTEELDAKYFGLITVQEVVNTIELNEEKLCLK